MLDGRQFGLGRPASASLGDADPRTGKRRALYEPVHGSAPDIAGRGLANAIAMIGSFGMALRYSFGLNQAAERLEAAIAEVLGPRASEPPTSDAKARASSPPRKWATPSSPNSRTRPPKASPTKRTSPLPAVKLPELAPEQTPPANSPLQCVLDLARCRHSAANVSKPPL